MTIAELITKLREYDPATMVVVHGYEGGYDDPYPTMTKLVVRANLMEDGRKRFGCFGDHDDANPFVEDRPVTEALRL